MLIDTILKNPEYITSYHLREWFSEALTYDDLTTLNVLHKISNKHNKKIVCSNNERGEWTDQLTNFIGSQDNIVVVPIQPKHTTNPDIMSLCEGFIAPGGADSYPYSPWVEKDSWHVIMEELYIYLGNTFQNTINHLTGYSASLPIGAFNISYLHDNSSTHLEHEYAYQNSINYAEEHNKFFLGSCLGAQQLILKHGGYVARTQEEHFNSFISIHTMKVISGSRIHYLTMTNYEHNIAINEGYFPDIEFPIITEHMFAGIIDNIGDLQIGGVSDAGAVEAVTNNWYQIGLQFHAEKSNNVRNKILMDNIGRFLQVDSDHLEPLSNLLDEEWNDAFSKAKCFDEICPVQTGFLRDIFLEAKLHVYEINE